MPKIDNKPDNDSEPGSGMLPNDAKPDALERRLLNDFQRGFPLTPAPFADIARDLGITEAEVLKTYARLQEQGVVSRIGAVFRPHQVGDSALAAMAVPPARLKEVADLVSGYTEVNHNYEREHHYNLWFVATAPDAASLEAVFADIEKLTNIKVLRLPMLEDYHIDLAFPLNWRRE